MNKYTIYCTESQTKKALELGAPIICIWNGFYEGDEKEVPYFREIRHGIKKKIKPPTSEQMIGWLEEQGVMFNIAVNPFDDFKVIMSKAGSYDNIANIKWNHSRKAATLAAIDAALDYLEKQNTENESK